MQVVKVFALLLLQSACSVCFAFDVIVFIGAPGSGKGTQAKLLSNKLHIPHIAVGDTLRSAAKANPALDREMKPYLSSGQMVPEHIVTRIMLNRLTQDDCKHGIILDGAIRSIEDIAQTKAILKQIDANITHVFYLAVSDQILYKRLSGRRVCQNCGQNFHTQYAPAKNDKKCDICQHALIQRKDDVAIVISQRIAEFSKQAKLLLEYYRANELLHVIDGSGKPDEIAVQISMLVQQ